MFSTCEDSAGTGDTIRAQLGTHYEKYTGPLFYHDEDTFVDKAGKTGVFLLENERGDPILYFLDMEAYASIKGQDGKKQGEYPLHATPDASFTKGASFLRAILKKLPRRKRENVYHIPMGLLLMRSALYPARASFCC